MQIFESSDTIGSFVLYAVYPLQYIIDYIVGDAV